MTTIPPMIRARVDGIPGLAAKGHTGQQSKMADQSRQLGQLSIDRSSSAAGSISINNPSINMLEAPVGCAASPYIQHLYGRGDLSC
jgi:hypothetical protein